MSAWLLVALLATPAEQGEAIAARAEQAAAGWGTERVRVTLTIEGERGKTATLTFRLSRVETPTGERSLVELLDPRKKGVRILTEADAEGDTTFVKLPRFGVRRIVGRSRSGRFLGSHLSYEDLGARRAARAAHTWVRDEPVDGVLCHVVDSVPRDADSSYGKVRLWREVETLRLRQLAWYGPDGLTVKKRGALSDYAQIGGHWRAHRLEVTDAATQRSTRLVFSDREVGLTLPPDEVSQRGLTR